MDYQKLDLKDINEKANEIFQEKFMQSIYFFKKETDKIEAEKKIINHIINNYFNETPLDDFVEIDLNYLFVSLKITGLRPSLIINDCAYLLKELIDDIQVVSMVKNDILIISPKKP